MQGLRTDLFLQCEEEPFASTFIIIFFSASKPKGDVQVQVFVQGRCICSGAALVSCNYLNVLIIIAAQRFLSICDGQTLLELQLLFSLYINSSYSFHLPSADTNKLHLFAIEGVLS